LGSSYSERGSAFSALSEAEWEALLEERKALEAELAIRKEILRTEKI
jgi:hypothetical protein